MANYDANYDDERLTQVESDKSEALSDLEESYAGMINRSDKYFDKQIQATEKWADKQSAIQQEQTDFAIEQIEQQKAQTEKDYKKEQSGAYVDWQKQSNAYGVNAEKTAAAGLAGSGYSETMQVSMYNTYQQRVSAAREVFNMAVLDYNNAIKDARLQNNAALAQIAYEALQKKLELSLQGFQYKNQLILEKANKKLEVENIYHSRYMDVLNQINTENTLAEEVRQFEANYELQVKEYEEGIRQFNEEIERLKEKDAAEHKLEIEKLEMQKAQLAEEARQFDESAKLEREKLAASSSKSSASISDSSGSNGGSAVIPRSNSTSGNAEGAVITSESKGTGTPQKYQVNTPYYQGKINPDALKFGTFSNGYQPKGISGHGKLTKTGDTITLETKTLAGQKQTLVQNVWEAEDGTKWYWEGRQNAYIRISTHGGRGGKF